MGDAERDIGVTVDSQWIDIRKIRRWLDCCDESHVGNCDRALHLDREESLQNLLLVDVHQACLVSLPITTRYFALSYVWGQLSGSIETRRDNIDSLKQKGAVSSDTDAIRLPNTIRDALRLVQSLGERYLWVDRLSIVQDDISNKNIHVMSMDSIFANAYCTIVACDGEDADRGLRGVGLGSTHRSYSPHILRFPQCALATRINYWSWMHSYHGTRGWNFQEVFLSRRTLIFSKDTVEWQCQKSIWKEDILGDAEGVVYGFPEPVPWMLPLDTWPNVPRWGGLVREYNDRNLTLASDARAAFIGIERSLERSFPGGFIYGLPEFVFDAALLCIMVEDFYFEELTKCNGVYEFYNVLWIRWKDGYAVREALGRVEKCAWERQNLEEIDVRLR
ncbi:putative heterokaryon incompatibility protein [Neofusicoccum parvum]|uniref:Heterokaryon incompatibility protein n=1 Tax=Neofusicoccum parvum TaxID=310453 RepID=A0ACB5S767_9PEZI|nr:putative heterokaryon incompatibility protein [Neofusicoccum parvum]